VNIISVANEQESVLLNALKVLAATRSKLAAMPAGKWEDTRADIASQLQGLLGPCFQRDTPAQWLAQYPRYMKALQNRVERLPGQYTKDQQYTVLLQSLAAPLEETMKQREGLLLLCAPAEVYRWMLEEFRVSLFAQNLGTRQAVSEKRIKSQWQEVQAWLRENPH
jgi:ATP-dependent helicase HrpA